MASGVVQSFLVTIWHFSSYEKVTEAPGLLPWDLLICIDGQPPPSPRTGLPPSLPPARPPEIVRGARKSSGPVCGSRAQGIGRHMHRGRGEDEDVLPGKCRAPVSQRSGVSRRGRSTERQKRETQDLSQRYGLTELWELPVVSASLLSSLLMLQLEVRTGSYEGKIIPRRGKSIMSWNP